MSNEASPAPAGQSDPSSLPSTVMHPHKSYRRKYRKIMVKFERQMRESSTLFKDQQRIYDISQRIAEQNDQILSMLLELNSQPQVPARLRFDLADSTRPKQQPVKHDDTDQALETLRRDRHRIQKGELQLPEYIDYERGLLEAFDFAPVRSYADLLKGGPLEKPQDEIEDGTNLMAGGFLSTRQDEQYLESLDDFLDGKIANPRAHVSNSLGSRNPEKSAERERESQLRNPVSVYNWLRKNQPQVFLQDPDGEKAKLAASRKSKRESAVKPVKVEPELYDDEGIALDAGPLKGKRKRDEDGGYRPKGGNPRPTKRVRKEDPGRRSKRASMDVSGS